MDSFAAAFAGFGLLYFFLIMLIPLAIWIITLVSIIQSPNWTPAFKALWALAALSGGLIGMICWFVWGKNEGNRIVPQPYPMAAPYPVAVPYPTAPMYPAAPTYPAAPPQPAPHDQGDFPPQQ